MVLTSLVPSVGAASDVASEAQQLVWDDAPLEASALLATHLTSSPEDLRAWRVYIATQAVLHEASTVEAQLRRELDARPDDPWAAATVATVAADLRSGEWCDELEGLGALVESGPRSARSHVTWLRLDHALRCGWDPDPIAVDLRTQAAHDGHALAYATWYALSTGADISDKRATELRRALEDHSWVLDATAWLWSTGARGAGLETARAVATEQASAWDVEGSPRWRRAMAQRVLVAAGAASPPETPPAEATEPSVQHPYDPASSFYGEGPAAWRQMARHSVTSSPPVVEETLRWQWRDERSGELPAVEQAGTVGWSVPTLPWLDRGGVLRDTPSHGLVVVTLWATWCTPCKPTLEALAQVAPELEGAGAAVMALSVDVDRQTGLDAVQALGDAHTGTPVRYGWTGPEIRAWKVTTLPTTLVLLDGVVAASVVGQGEDATRLRDAVLAVSPLASPN